MSTLLVGLLALALAASPPQPPKAGSTTDYAVGPGDVLSISVFGEPALSQRYTVDGDGSFEFPLVGRILASGLTAREIEERLTRLLSDGYLKKPQISVNVEQFRSQSVFIIGEVRAPGKYALTGEMSLIEALAQAGGVLPSAGSEVLILRPSTDEPATEPLLPGEEGITEAERVDLAELQSGKLSSNIILRDGNTIFVPKAETFYVTGQVRNPGSFVLQSGMTVLQAISLAGGLTERGSDRRIKIIRMVDGKKDEINVKLTDLVKAGDTIVVSQRFF